MEPRPNPYHHPNLRTALIEVATNLIQTNGHESLRLRDLGFHAKVSRGAPYRHFKDKTDILAEVAADFLARMRSSVQEPSQDQTLSPREQLISSAVGYIEFGNANQELYALTFSQELSHSDNSRYKDELALLGASVFQAVKSAEQAGVINPTDSSAQTLISFLHGYTMLTIAGENEQDTTGTAVKTRTYIETLLNGLTSKPTFL